MIRINIGAQPSHPGGPPFLVLRSPLGALGVGKGGIDGDLTKGELDLAVIQILLALVQVSSFVADPAGAGVALLPRRDVPDGVRKRQV